MRIFITFIIAVISFTQISAQNINLEKLNNEQRNEYLIKLGKEVTKVFGPGYYREYGEPIISGVEKYDTEDTRTESIQNIGREYYTVTFPYDKSKEILDFDYASQVRVWKDTGEPLDVAFGNGYGKNFIFLSYKQQTMLKVEDTIPYQQATEPDTDIWQKED